MAKPSVAGRNPVVIELEPGTYYWCTCGLSKNQPFCDGSHKGSGLKSTMFKVEAKGKHTLCLCKHTSNPPFCDGTHRKLPEEA
ncbi:MAG: CDGSH iron-sulfur domain-containing protein [Candidatus Riflebacteria bacterium]|nr:CDGSH iron-sulfur domain-containing protein [Candidatus Riflebacteria bacterium]